ncbi:unnamed protein product [Caenorhabditis sp. 36 PRJEB53466]|nr:unnamed protein product [Caenorhabditis sp. 36 PRJEB53466]
MNSQLKKSIDEFWKPAPKTFRTLAQDSIKSGGIWEAEPKKLDRDERREDDTGSLRLKENKDQWNSRWKK